MKRITKVKIAGSISGLGLGVLLQILKASPMFSFLVGLMFMMAYVTILNLEEQEDEK